MTAELDNLHRSLQYVTLSFILIHKNMFKLRDQFHAVHDVG